jgi:hypothetical protein
VHLFRGIVVYGDAMYRREEYLMQVWLIAYAKIPD